MSALKIVFLTLLWTILLMHSTHFFIDLPWILSRNMFNLCCKSWSEPKSKKCWSIQYLRTLKTRTCTGWLYFSRNRFMSWAIRILVVLSPISEVRSIFFSHLVLSKWEKSISVFTLAKTEIIYQKNVGAQVSHWDFELFSSSNHISPLLNRPQGCQGC